jgi:hypothetical protein
MSLDAPEMVLEQINASAGQPHKRRWDQIKVSLVELPKAYRFNDTDINMFVDIRSRMSS